MTPASTLNGLLPLRAESASSLLPPPGFPVLDTVEHVALTTCPHHGRSRKTGAQKAGLAYQKKAVEFLNEEYGPSRLTVGPWFYAVCNHRRHYCQPDVIIEHGDGVFTIVEIKLRWDPRAWWQLKKLYYPVVRAYYRPRSVRLVCLTRSYDPFIHAPETPVILDELDSSAAGTGVGIFIWKP